ncbi:hypothetical protein [Bradyrhizobium erythrophlei]|jgi:hypothetical protein|uniref:Uncharacterized protein n=1 Tax=Bradyrhizobium erythrophlei TaxID=1437360 RepID=A0A1M7UKI2_9BRAD|nr:hypothetical protein [Bradyrhizobium erythrophlei]SHN83532.1 hypothetical protein SAMN05444170_5540 [Bradyrhizobium erythrophlei]
MTNDNGAHVKETLVEVGHELFELEEPLRRVRDLAHAVLMLATSDEMGKQPGAALHALANTILDELNDLIDRRDNIWRIAIDKREAADED